MQASGNGCYGARVGICYMEIELDGLRPLNEEGHRCIPGEDLTLRKLFEVWQRQWRGGKNVFTTNVQNSAAGYQQLVGPAVVQEVQKVLPRPAPPLTAFV